MIRRWLVSFLLVAAITINCQHPIRAGTPEDSLWTMIPGVSCGSTAIAIEQNFEGFRLVPSQPNLCLSFQNQFEMTTAKIADLRAAPDANTDEALFKWSKAIAALCKDIVLELKLSPSQHGCLFAIPTPRQPIAWSMFQLFVQGKLLDSYFQGSWCLRQSPIRYGDKRDTLLAEVFNDAHGGTEWQQVKSELIAEGFLSIIEDGSFHRALILSSSNMEDPNMPAIPSPVFHVYFGQEEMPRANMVPCGSTDTACAAKEAQKRPDGICMAVSVGWGP